MKASAATPEENLGVELGATLMGKYRIDAILGQGGMGVVARATHLHLGEQVAIKFLRADIAGDAEANQRFLREAHAAWKLKDEHVARVLDVGTLDNGLPYLVMEYLEGVDLDGMLEQSTRIAPMLACDFIVQACAGLAEAHALGIVHRDVKPSNFFVTWRTDGTPLVKLLDFGISKVANNTDVSLTQTQSMLGTPAYMSPEQMRSARNVDARTDVWSLGAVLYELCEGTRPFEAESFSEMCVKVAVDDPAPMTVALPPGLDAIIRRCLEKKPEARFPDVGGLAAALAPYTRDPAATAHLVERIDRRLNRSSAPVAIVDIASAPVAAPGMTPYPPRRTTPWAAGGAMPPVTPPPWSSPALTPPPIAAAATTLDESAEGGVTQQTPRPSMSISTPRRVGRIAAVAVVVAGLGLGAVVLFGGSGDRAPTGAPTISPGSAAGSAPDGPGSATGSATDGPGSAAGSATDGPGSAAGSSTDGPGSAAGSATDGPGSAAVKPGSGAGSSTVGTATGDRVTEPGRTTNRRTGRGRKPRGGKPGDTTTTKPGDLYNQRK